MQKQERKEFENEQAVIELFNLTGNPVNRGWWDASIVIGGKTYYGELKAHGVTKRSPSFSVTDRLSHEGVAAWRDRLDWWLFSTHVPNCRPGPDDEHYLVFTDEMEPLFEKWGHQIDYGGRTRAGKTELDYFNQLALEHIPKELYENNKPFRTRMEFALERAAKNKANAPLKWVRELGRQIKCTSDITTAFKKKYL